MVSEAGQPRAACVAQYGAQDPAIERGHLLLRARAAVDTENRPLAVQLDALLDGNLAKPQRERLTLNQIYEALRGFGCESRRYCRPGQGSPAPQGHAFGQDSR